MTMYRTITKPTNMFTIANPGVARGLPKKAATVDQSRANEPIPRPRRPEPSCWAVTESFHIQQAKERAVIDGNR